MEIGTTTMSTSSTGQVCRWLLFLNTPSDFRKFSSTPASQLSSTQRAACQVIRNQTLFTLGILLIELLYGKSTEELQSPRDLDSQGTPSVA